MNQKSKNIIGEIDAHMKKSSYQNKDWYVGIASKPTDRLFTDHNVDQKNGIWIYKTAESDTEAREIEKAYLDTGHDGGDGGGDSSTTYVYAYVKLKGTVR